MSITTILGALLALSVLGNAWLFNSLLGVRDERTEAIGARDQARAAASACSEATEVLRKQAGQRQAANAAARDQARTRAQGHQQRAQQILQAPAAVPGDDCKSAGAAIDTWLSGRKAP